MIHHTLISVVTVFLYSCDLSHLREDILLTHSRWRYMKSYFQTKLSELVTVGGLFTFAFPRPIRSECSTVYWGKVKPTFSLQLRNIRAAQESVRSLVGRDGVSQRCWNRAQKILIVCFLIRFKCVLRSFRIFCIFNQSFCSKMDIDSKIELL